MLDLAKALEAQGRARAAVEALRLGRGPFLIPSEGKSLGGHIFGVVVGYAGGQEGESRGVTLP